MEKRRLQALYTVVVLWISETLALCRASESPAALVVDGSYQQTLDDFALWLEGRGVKLGVSKNGPMKILLSSMQEGVDPSKTRPQMKVVATRDIKRGEDIAVFPSSVMVHTQNLEDPYKPGMEDSDNWKDYTTIAAWLLREKFKGKTSEWSPYIAMLPDFVPLTYTFSPEALQLFEDQWVIYGTQGWLEILKKEFNKTRPEALGNASYDKFMHAMSVVMSRVYASGDGKDLEPDGRSIGDLLDDGAKFSAPAALIPLADMVNHGDRCTWKRLLSANGIATHHKDGGFAFKAVEDISEGEELIASYGKHENGMLVLIYGYVPDVNLDEHMPIAASVHDAVDWFEKYALKSKLKSLAKKAAKSLTEAAQASVESVWEDMRSKYRSIRARWRAQQAGHGAEGAEFEAVSMEEGENAVEFLTRTTYAIRGEDDERTIAVWSKGMFDPRFMGALAALVFHQEDLKKRRKFTPDVASLEALARASITYSWNLEDTWCDSSAALEHEKHKEAMLGAGTVLQKKLEEYLGAFPTTASADRKCLARVEMCDSELSEEPQGTEDSHEDEELAGLCMGEVFVKQGIPKHEVIMGLKFRAQRKEMLEQVINRLSLTCVSAAAAAPA